MDTKFGVVYRVFDANEPGRVRYVGQTINGLRSRERSHWGDARRSTRPLYPFARFLKKRPDDGTVVFEEIETVPISELDEREIHWIAYYRGIGQADLNITDGGGGYRGRVYTDEEREAKRQYMLGRFRGELAPSAKLNWSQVREIRDRRQKSWVSEVELAEEYGITQMGINAILRNTYWVDEGFDPATIKVRPPETHANNRQIPLDMVQEIRALRMREWVPEKEIARRYGLTRSNVNNILRNHRWPDPDYKPELLVRAGGDGLGSKLTRNQADEIRLLKGSGLTQTRIGEMYGISQTQVSRIFRGVRWA